MTSVSSVATAAAIPSTVDTAAPPPPNKAERPPLQHVETSGYTTASAPPVYAYASDPEKGGSPKGNKTVLRRQHPNASGSGILLKEVDKLQGYREIPGGHGGKKPPYAHHNPNNFSLSSPDNTNVVLDEDIKKTKVSFNFFFFRLFWTLMHQPSSGKCTPTS